MRKLDFAERIRSLRSEMDLTQWQLAGALETTQRIVFYWELGKTAPALLTLWKIADFVNIVLHFLCFFDNQKMFLQNEKQDYSLPQPCFFI